ncbi:hypothetical protein [Streptomyces cavernae]|uniref:hypothetical protein n=1 Tax=Streptomyces cavernae TaxID=2259034 RepID=UPI000FEB6FEA|nr:hypothetical protein [Streptomyces cavernae]
MSDRSSAGTTHRPRTRGLRVDRLGIYLNDHLAGATLGTERARHLAQANRGSAVGETVRPIAAEIAQDRASLLEIMRRLDVPVQRYKVYASRFAERLGRLKPNGNLIHRSPLSTLLELELLRIGVEGKAAAWRALRRISGDDDRLDPDQLDRLLERAMRQIETLEDLRLRQVDPALREH